MPHVPIRLRLPDGTLLSAEFTRLIYQRGRRQFWRKRLPRLKRGYIRFQASDHSIHDIPERNDTLNHALSIDPKLVIIDNANLRRFDRDLMRSWRWLRAAAARFR
jgi:hypothetical protein